MLNVISILVVQFSLTCLACASQTYEWRKVADVGRGCFPPNCREGQFAMAIKPVVAFENKLFIPGDKTVWISADGTNWRSKPKTDWGERYGMQFAYFRDKLWMFGGLRTWDDFRNDVWSSTDGTKWTQETANAPWQARRGHGTVIFDNKIWVIGGSVSSGRRDQTPTRWLNDVWSSTDGVNWKLVTDHAPWQARECSTALVFDSKIWIIGGRGVSDVWSSADGKTWEQHTANADWGVREGAGVAGFDGKIWVYGGIEKNDVWSSADGKKWTQVFAAAPWSTRSTVYSTVYKNRLMLFSGKTGRTDTQQGEIWAMERKTE